MSKPVDHPSLGPIGLIKMPINMPDIPDALEIRSRAPELGEHTEDVLKECGYSEKEIDDLREAGVI